MKVEEMKFINIGFDEDGYSCIDEGIIGKYEYRGFLRKDGCCSIEDEFEVSVNKFVNSGNEKEWFEDDDDGKDELVKFNENKKKFDELKSKFGGVILSWCVEYDNQWILIYDENEVVDKMVDDWLDREYDESEFVNS